ncbi:ROK family protein [Mesotoga sp.]|uniref:ROK family transcriptional regulator n=1 Tax=Mesotoga sp. TaxID=2053577 RepID=UPI00345E51AE
MATKASKEIMKEINEKLLLRGIYSNEGIDRASLAKLTGLSPATVTKVVGELIESGLVEETGVADSTGGRKPILLSIQPKKLCVLGLKIGVGYLDYSLTDLFGTVLVSERRLLDNQSPEEVVSATETVLNEWRKLMGESLLGIGIAVSGIVDSLKGVVKNSFLLNWKEVPIAELISERSGKKTFVMNDVDSFALAQFWKGDVNNHKNCVFITLGVGIGGAVAIDGKLHLTGAGSGEFGHMTISQNGNRCTCGSTGCLEAQASFEVLARKVFSRTASSELKELYSSVKATETSEIHYLKRAVEIDRETTIGVFQEYSEDIGTALKNLINIFAPDYLLIGGEALEFSEFFLESSIDNARRNAFSSLADNVVFDIDRIGEKAWTLGCIYRVIESELFTVRR